MPSPWRRNPIMELSGGFWLSVCYHKNYHNTQHWLFLSVWLTVLSQYTTLYACLTVPVCLTVLSQYTTLYACLTVPVCLSVCYHNTALYACLIVLVWLCLLSHHTTLYACLFDCLTDCLPICYHQKYPNTESVFVIQVISWVVAVGF